MMNSDDIKLASRCLLEDGFAIDINEAIRLGNGLAEMAEKRVIIASRLQAFSDKHCRGKVARLDLLTDMCAALGLRLHCSLEQK